jgi:hypothetical protein
LVDVRFATRNRLRIRTTAAEPALGALGLRQEVVDLLYENHLNRSSFVGRASLRWRDKDLA